MSVLIAYPFHIELMTDNTLTYLPELAKLEEADLCEKLEHYVPDILVVGNNKISSKTIKRWRKIKGNKSKLVIIRRGTSIARIDNKAAYKANIDVLNTPGVNAPSVANFILKKLDILDTTTLPENLNKKLAVIGSGRIGARIAKHAAAIGYNVIIYSPSLASEKTRKLALDEKGLNIKNISLAKSPILTVENADLIAIAVDANKINSSEDQFKDNFVTALKQGVKIVSVSENKVFSHTALKKLIYHANNKLLSLTIDSTPPDIAELKDMASSLTNVALGSNAMKDPNCQIAMDQAVLVTLADIALNNVTFNTLSKKKDSITIVGGGINGLISALMLQEKRHDITILDAIQDPVYRIDKKYTDSTSWEGCNGRHISVTESIPHATPARADVMKKHPAQGGWKLINDFKNTEKIWVQQFENTANFPELQSIFTKFVSGINCHGILTWKQIFQKYTEIGTDIIQSERIVRIFKSTKELNKAFDQQFKLHRIDKNGFNFNIIKLSKEDLMVRFPGIDITQIEGGLEVEGMIINFYALCDKLRDYLEKRGVNFFWNSKVTEITSQDDKVSIFLQNGKKFFAEKVIITVGHQAHHFLKDSNVKNKVQGVAGLWITLPNISGLQEGFKIHEAEPIGVINVTISSDKKELYFTGGFGYIGQEDLSLDDIHVQKLFALLKEAIKKYLPSEYKAAMQNGNLQPKLCVRPMTSDGMPIIQFIDDKQIYFSGTNAAGTVESPILSSIIAAGISGNKSSQKNVSHIIRALSTNRGSL